MSRGGRARAALLVALAASATAVGAVLALGVGVVGQAQYLNDYCLTRAEPPAELVSRPEYGSRGPFFEGPVRLRCEYDVTTPPTGVVVTDAGPLVWWSGLGVALLLWTVLVWWPVVRGVRARRWTGAPTGESGAGVAH